MTLTPRRCFEKKMGCGSSANTVVEPLEDVNGDEDERESKLGGRGDSAVSKGTTDSGVVMEHKDILVLPGAVPSKLPPLTSESIRESEAERDAQDAAAPGFLKQDRSVPERPKSSEILEELLSQGIIPVGQSSKGTSGAAYSIVLDDREDIVRKPPARLESLKAKKAEVHFSKEEMEEKMRLAEERRKLKEEKIKMRLRIKSARVRVPARISSTEECEDAFLTPVEALQSPLTTETSPTPEHLSQIPHKATEGGGWVRWADGDGKGCEEKATRADERAPGEDGEGGDDGKKEEEEVTQVKELMASELLTMFGELESDSSFLHGEEVS